ncbi:hypothetical protein GH714_028793 [Hevea brasiliensis]|uniref:RING-type domain-containing protein n=1 Tax=Hevea brasiliensis TaxID=3981 RepID=A0A6A6LL40_HEVBR|nr:hypothetical protein GH714_028793 [Hevea brasiliensis]
MINNRDRQLQVIAALAQSGLGSSNLIVGIDFTKSNEWTGARSFNRRSLHHIGSEQNPYEQAISIIGRTLSAFDEDNLIPCFGFGDGPTSFAPIIEMAITIVEQSSGRYHVLLIIADGRKETEFALAALMEVPAQYKATIELGIMGRRSGNAPERVPLPHLFMDHFFSNSGTPSSSNRFHLRAPSFSGSESPVSGYDSSLPSYSGYDSQFSEYDTPVNTTPYSSSTYDDQVCPICLTNRKDMAFGCGHQTCCECGEDLQSCPICRSSIQIRIKLY